MMKLCVRNNLEKCILSFLFLKKIISVSTGESMAIQALLVITVLLQQYSLQLVKLCSVIVIISDNIIN